MGEYGKLSRILPYHHNMKMERENKRAKLNFLLFALVTEFQTLCAAVVWARLRSLRRAHAESIKNQILKEAANMAVRANIEKLLIYLCALPRWVELNYVTLLLMMTIYVWSMTTHYSAPTSDQVWGERKRERKRKKNIKEPARCVCCHEFDAYCEREREERESGIKGRK